MTGIDIIGQVVGDLQLLVKTATTNATTNNSAVTTSNNSVSNMGKSIREHVRTINFCVSNIRNTNVFMLMTINRCIDYTKASKGLMLVPKYETVDLSDALLLPLSCMRNIQNKVSIELRPLDSTLCSHVITDKQWLQENLLCLLSNAVKYSSEGQVTIAVSLQARVEVLDGPSPVNAVPTPALATISNDNGNGKSSCTSTGNGTGTGIAVNGHGKNGKTCSGDKHDCAVVPLEDEACNTTLPVGCAHSTDDLQLDDLSHLSRLSKESVDCASCSKTPSIAHSHSQIHPALEPLQPPPSLGEPRGGSCKQQQQQQQQQLQLQQQQQQLSEYLHFEIEDHGIGVDHEKMKILFNPFKQAQRLAGGTGLGLYSLAKRVEALKGRCGVRRRRDGQQGSLFWFSIPYRPDVTATADDNDDDEDNEEEITRERLQQLHSHTGSNTQRSLEGLEGLLDDSPERMVLSTMPLTPFSASGGGLEHSFGAMETSSSSASRQLWPREGTAGEKHKESTCTYRDPSRERLRMARKDTPLRILIVEDSPAIAKMTSLLLKRHGHHVTVAENGEIALRRIRHRWEELDETAFSDDKLATAFDVVLMDLQMPVMDGLEATKRLRELEALRGRDSQCVIGVSANSDHETAVDAFHSGIDNFISKPFNIDSFYKIVRSLAMGNIIGQIQH
jgi:CheY-like chemotaxis protein